jgi:hypothetical protein
MRAYWTYRENAAVHAWRVLSAWIATLALAAVLAAPGPAISAGAMPHEDPSGVTISLEPSQEPADLSGHAMAYHMHFEHHQLVRSEIFFPVPFPESVPVFYLTRVNPLSSREPYPLRKPPRS